MHNVPLELHVEELFISLLKHMRESLLVVHVEYILIFSCGAFFLCTSFYQSVISSLISFFNIARIQNCD